MLRFMLVSAFFLALTVVLFRGLFDGAYITGTDSTSTIYGPAMQQAYGSYFSTWDFFDSVGFLAYPSVALSALNQLFLGTIGMSATDFAKLQLLGSFWLAGVISFYVLRAMFGSEKAAFFGSLVYVANGAFINQFVEGHFGFITAYPFLILIFYLFHDAYWNGISRKTLVLPALLLVFGGAVAPHMVLLVAIMVILYAALAWILYSGARAHTAYKALLTASMAALVVLPLAYTMVVLGNSSVLDTYYTLEEASAGSSSLLTAISVGGGEITNTYAYYGSTAGVALLSVTQFLAIPLFFFAMASLFVRKYRRLTVPLVFIIVFDMFMAMGPNQPLGFLFTFMFDHIPLVDSFRATPRFLLLNAVFYSMLITISAAHWREIAETLSRAIKFEFKLNVERKGFWSVLNKVRFRGMPGPSRRVAAVLTAVLLVATLSGLVVIANGDVVKAFDAPAEYAEPFEYIASVDTGDGGYKIYTLPMITDCYQHPFQTSISGYGYPKGTTLDPGAFLPTTIDRSGMAHFAAGPDFWSGIQSIIEERLYGYNDTLALLGSSAAVKYVVEQWYASQEERDAFANMSGGTVLADYLTGAKVIGVDAYSGQINAQSGLIVASGDLDAMFLLMGAGVFDPAATAYASLSSVDPADLPAMLEASDLIVVPDGSLIELARELGLLDGQLLDLQGQVNVHRGDQGSQWVPDVDQVDGRTSVITSGSHLLTVRPGTDIPNGTNLMIRAAFGPDQGTLGVLVNGLFMGTVNLTAPFSGAQWVSVSIPDYIDRVDSVSLVGSDNGRTTQVYDAALMSEQGESSMRQQLEELLGPYRDKIGYAFTPLYMFLSDRTAQLWSGPQGNGVMSANGTYTVPFETLFGSSYRLAAYSPEGNRTEVRIDGDVHGSEWSSSSGAYNFEVRDLAAGDHWLGMYPNGTYGLALLPSHQFGGGAPEITYEKVSATEYRLSVRNAAGPFVIKFSEGSSKYWTMSVENGSASWFRSDYLANGFLVNGTGDLTITLEFAKQAEYDAFVLLYGWTLVAGTALVTIAYLYRRWTVKNHQGRPVTSLVDEGER
jgi:hypothetical protein